MQFEKFNEEHLDREPFLGNMWANINPPGGYNRPHYILIVILVVCIILKLQRKCGDIVFKDPRSTAHMAMPARKKGEPS